jgi:hypothetical protein
MSNKKKRARRPIQRSVASGAPARPEPGPARRDGKEPSPPRRERKEAVRREREAQRKRAVRQSALRRVTVLTLAMLVAFLALSYLHRAPLARPIPAADVAAAKAAGCTTVQTPAASAPGNLHLQPNQAYTYTQHPATSGYHDPSPLGFSTHVFTAPVPETRAVHNLEHAGIFIYYRPDGDGALPKDVVDALAQVANTSRNTVMAPYRDLPIGTSLALAAWNKLQTCPGTINKDQAAAVAQGFEYSLSCTSNAPEAKAAGNGC